MIKCELVPILSSESSNTKPRFGRYHGSCFWDVKNFGSKKWVVAAYIKVEDSSLLEGATTEMIARGCVEYLNQPPPRKKYAKRIPKPKYGALEYYSARIVEKEDGKYISALLVTDTRKNKLFWGKGKNV
tara:strand:- start:236 stop:622 length:387 start_codon:yes stop_codon:yes gene_type:complete